MMTKESNVNSESKPGPFLLNEFYVYDMTVPLPQVKSDQLCYEPEPYSEQLERMKREIVDDESLIRNFRFNYPNAYNAFIIDQREKLIDFIKGWNKE